MNMKEDQCFALNVAFLKNKLGSQLHSTQPSLGSNNTRKKHIHLVHHVKSYDKTKRKRKQVLRSLENYLESKIFVGIISHHFINHDTVKLPRITTKDVS